ncbi:DUF4232 domain-containing protein [Nocardia otitidiscaviarum]|uniref:DUF4232 domain-containing protein n=1 Tax=Nocardia otitidiscaviarum TaxID=1823 RepID=A0A378YFN5_9NOCA|nr:MULTISPECIES: DUF4232 domain-containing protein [Nocardia]MBF6134233.1 DUF4232 domain-containing protein [Nocardia otitidiscaviarum]MBF6179190.1 DUF4232 domain-containing protein [Nocardia otitidiscaviarum]MBF6484105.1 DUF4232 domain-containing protein [Nocardia otitidiscaviarum]MCP9621487.1 DUF4232 domain-containing protein [Nocardia otitidiscaviarum]QDP82165.1 hypothetical protein FOH10_28980 [Nocardia otitidiscaviarum]
MLEPNGPLPPEIYWRRRLLAIGALVVALALVLWLAFALLRGDGDDSSAAADTTTAATNKAAGSSSDTSESDSAQSQANATAEAGPAAQGKQCPDQSLAVKVSVGAPTYKAGEQPVFGIVITNISSEACERDMGSGLQEVAVTSLDGQRRMWASTDCYPEGTPDVRTLQPGQQAAFTVTWSGSTSQPNCAGERVPVPPGPYSVVAQLGSVTSSPEPFNIT